MGGPFGPNRQAEAVMRWNKQTWVVSVTVRACTAPKLIACHLTWCS
jgi:hypothetical protein